MYEEELKRLAERVRRDVETYEPPPRHPLNVGSPLPPEWFEAGLRKIRDLLVPPYTLLVEDPHREPGVTLKRDVIIVAEDADRLLAYDPHPEGDFVLAFRLGPDRVSLDNLLRGGAAETFLSR